MSTQQSCTSDHQPPGKRRRTSSEDQGESLRRSDIFYEDGSVVLQAESVLFRVHRSILASYSDVFRDMFSLPQPSTDEKIEGCSIVHLSDRAEDLKHLLKTLYDWRYLHNGGEEQPFHVISALLRLGKKYAIHHLYKEAKSYLTTDFPTSLQSWIEDPARRIQDYQGIEFDVISLARETGLLSIMPTCFYLGVKEYERPHEEMLRGWERPDPSLDVFSFEDQVRAVLGRDEVLREQYKTLWIKDEKIQSCQDEGCKERRQEILLEILEPPGEVVALNFWHEEWDERLCAECGSRSNCSRSQQREVMGETPLFLWASRLGDTACRYTDIID
ncbi:hypothetical protein JAAARDRAFT_36100 [Jaapia argillacea MUCL 33604]|uniref:BTB domain-containing protein n=1 Tax=Jaapia argillacea MUCL 33604 TaxID=933084 RepID=A0A067PP94_9AGAM|nr:hypothetical protein JAAARDRAFT_36100 [Jaapia argillacea MUCL 33604]